MHIVIRAGGVGTRLWPVSRSTKPKQLHALVGDKTLLQQSVDRVLDIAQVDDVYISCNADTAEKIQSEVANVRNENIIIEPALRDTAAAVGLETVMIAKDDPNAIIASLGSDHIIRDTKEFQRILLLAEKAITEQPESILCIGISPEGPDTGYGYIELDAEISPEVFSVKSFKEKPDMATAQGFIDAGNYLWNANMFVWRADTLLKLFEQYQPEMYAKLMQIQENPEAISEIYPTIDKVAVDYAIIENAPSILAVPGNFGWNDIGDWVRLKDELQADAASTTENIIKGNNVDESSTNIMVYSDTDRIIATIGLEDLIVVDTEDALLVCHKDRSQDVKEIVNRLKDSNQDNVL